MEETGNEMGEEREMVRIIDGQSIEFSLPNKLGYERIAMEGSASFARIVGFVSERIEDLKTAVAEACINAIEHGNKARPDARVLVTMNYGDGVLSVSVKDEGEGIDEFPEEPDILKKIEHLQTPRGLGIFLIKQLVDQVEFNKMTSKGYVVRMLIKMKG